MISISRPRNHGCDRALGAQVNDRYFLIYLKRAKKNVKFGWGDLTDSERPLRLLNEFLLHQLAVFGSTSSNPAGKHDSRLALPLALSRERRRVSAVTRFQAITNLRKKVLWQRTILRREPPSVEDAMLTGRDLGISKENER